MNKKKKIKKNKKNPIHRYILCRMFFSSSIRLYRNQKLALNYKLSISLLYLEQEKKKGKSPKVCILISTVSLSPRTTSSLTPTLSAHPFFCQNQRNRRVFFPRLVHHQAHDKMTNMGVPRLV